MRLLHFLILAVSFHTSLCLFEGLLRTGLGALQSGLGAVESSFNKLTGHELVAGVYSRILGITNVKPDPESSYPLPVPTKLTLLPIEDVRHYLHFAAAAYCEGETLADFKCYECEQAGSYVEMIQVLKNASLDSQGFVSADPIRKEIIVTFRGLHTPTNVLTQFNLNMTDSPLGDGARVHEGFLAATMSLYGQVSYIVSSQLRRNPEYRVLFTGHSSGAAMATLTYYLLSAKLPQQRFALVTFGEPRVGDQRFADIINSRAMPSVRVVNEGDVIPHIFAWSLGFVHHQTEYWTQNGVTRICSNKAYEDLTCSASLPFTKLLLTDHLSYLGSNIGLNCIEQNTIGGFLGMLGK